MCFSVNHMELLFQAHQKSKAAANCLTTIVISMATAGMVIASKLVL